MPHRVTILAALALLIVIWGTTWAGIRVGLEGLPPFTGASLRFLVAGAALLAVARVAGVPRQSGSVLRRLWLVEWFFAFTVSYGIVYWAEQWVPSGLSAVLFSTFPLFVAVLAHFLLPAEPLRWSHLLGILVAVVGVAVISVDDLTLPSSQAVFAALVLLGSPLAAAVSHVLVKKWGHGVEPVNLVAVPMIAAGVALGVLALGVERHRTLVFDAKSMGAVLYLALAGSALTFTVYYWLLDRLPATRLALIAYGIPLVALVVGTVGLGEPFTMHAGAGSLCVLAGVALAIRR